MKIILCEDNEKFRKNIETVIQRYSIIENLSVEIVLSTNNPNDVINHISKNNYVDCYFLDIDLGDTYINGLELAKQIRKNDKFSEIIFLTSHDEYTHFSLNYNIKAVDYIIKDEINGIREKITSILKISYDNYINKINTRIEYNKIPIKLSEGFIFVNIDDILFFETYDKKIRVILKQNYIIFRGTLTEIEKLSPFFLKVHSSFVINLKNVFYFNEQEKRIYFTKNIFCDVSRRNTTKLKNIIKKYNPNA